MISPGISHLSGVCVGGKWCGKGENMGIMASERGGVGGCRSYDPTKSFENTVWELSDHLKNLTPTWSLEFKIDLTILINVIVRGNAPINYYNPSESLLPKAKIEPLKIMWTCCPTRNTFPIVRNTCLTRNSTQESSKKYTPNCPTINTTPIFPNPWS